MASKLKQWRLERQLTQYELAIASGLPRWLIQLIETGIRNPSPQQMETLEETLGAKIFNSEVKNDLK